MKKLDYSKINTQADCAQAMKQVLNDPEMRSGEQSRAMQSLETLSKTINSALIEEERRGNESKTAIKKVVIEFVSTTMEDLDRLETIDNRLREIEASTKNGVA